MPKMTAMNSPDDEAIPSRLHSLRIPNDVWESMEDVARDEGKRIGRHVSVSEIIRDGAVREVRRLRTRLDRK